MDKVRIDNELPICHTEVVAFLEFTSGLVEDRPLGIVTRQDRLALWNIYTNSPTPGKYLISSGNINYRLIVINERNALQERDTTRTAESSARAQNNPCPIQFICNIATLYTYAESIINIEYLDFYFVWFLFGVDFYLVWLTKCVISAYLS